MLLLDDCATAAEFKAGKRNGMMKDFKRQSRQSLTVKGYKKDGKTKWWLPVCGKGSRSWLQINWSPGNGNGCASCNFDELKPRR